MRIPLAGPVTYQGRNSPDSSDQSWKREFRNRIKDMFPDQLRGERKKLNRELRAYADVQNVKAATIQDPRVPDQINWKLGALRQKYEEKGMTWDPMPAGHAQKSK
jgi:hypothetical protein